MVKLSVPYNTTERIMSKSIVTPEKRKEYSDRHKESNPDWKEKHAVLNKRWITNNRERYNQLKAEYRFKLKVDAISHYSGGTMQCAICGFGADLDALCLDHINDDGAEHRKALKCGGRGNSGGTTIYERFKALGWLPGLQVLCANCNTIKAIRLRRGSTAAAQYEIIKAKPDRSRK